MLSRVFCMRLNTYGVVIGWLGVILSFLATILLSVALGFVDEIAQQIAKESKDSDMTVTQIRSVLVIIFSVYLALKVINLLASAMLVAGTVKERHLLLLPWLINNGVLLVFGIVTNIAMLAQVIGSTPFLSALPIILVDVGLLVLTWYLYYGIYSLFKQIQASSEVQRPLIPAPTQQQTNSYPSYTKI
ncbi:uncharacterized protein LOC6735184 [Drosophila simulans]|uniref:GD25356 n=1 Tax=Drosophila simulans TaxID=7240 RepID=B4QD38_DROSI|nr:uncharacterized protein LOC6735184 [Drosophila simulans]EDX07743.1 GD25356 [Drosophila simulans]KMY94951.1 uncharacterized protein Dsimw501_GD25356 [Drosophila simulans]